MVEVTRVLNAALNVPSRRLRGALLPPSCNKIPPINPSERNVQPTNNARVFLVITFHGVKVAELSELGHRAAKNREYRASGETFERDAADIDRSVS